MLVLRSCGAKIKEARRTGRHVHGAFNIRAKQSEGSVMAFRELQKEKIIERTHDIFEKHLGNHVILTYGAATEKSIPNMPVNMDF